MTIISLSLTLHLSFYFSLTIAIFTFSYSGLDLTEYVHCSDDAQPVYDLYAISNHFGGMGGGHCELVTQTPQISEISFLFLSLSFFSLSPPSPSLYLPPPPPPLLFLSLSLSPQTLPLRRTTRQGNGITLMTVMFLRRQKSGLW